MRHFGSAKEIFVSTSPERVPRLLLDMARLEERRLNPWAADSLLLLADSLAVLHDPPRRVPIRLEAVELAISMGHAGRAERLLHPLLNRETASADAARIYIAQGNLHKLKRDFEGVRESCRRALSHADASGSSRLVALCYNNLGTLEMAVGSPFERQLAFFDSSLAVIRLDEAPNTWLLSQQNRGIVLDNMGRHEEAARVFSEVLEESIRLGREDFRIACLKDHGDLHAHQGKYELAISTYREAASRADSIGNWDLLERALEAMGDSRFAQGRIEEARDTWALAQEVIENVRRDIQLDHSRRVFLESRRSIAEKRIRAQLSLQEEGQALETLDGMKARTLLDQMEGAWLLLEQELPPQDAAERQALERALGHRHRELLRAEVQGETAAEERRLFRERFERARRDLQAFDLELFERQPGLGRRAGAFPGQSLREMARLLQENQLAVSWLVEEERITAFCLRSRGRSTPELRVVEIGISREELRSQMQEMRQDWIDQSTLPAVLRSPPAPGSAEARLFDRLLLPVLEQAEGVDHLLMIPDRELHDMPFHALYDCTTDSRVAQNLQLSTAPGFRALAELRLTGTRGREDLLVLGAGAGAQTREMGLLPGVGRELEAIRQAYGRRARFLRDSLATETALRRQADEYGVLHFAAHCRIDPERPAHSAILLQADSEHDGLLEAREIARFELDADLAVLSACNTHSGPLAGAEGVLGLSRAFFSARVPTVVASRWPVDDRITARFMESFYTRLAAGHRPLAALHLAQREMLGRDPLQSPLEWGGFVILGDCD